MRDKRVQVGSQVLLVMGDLQVRPAQVTRVLGTERTEQIQTEHGVQIETFPPMVNLVVTLDGDNDGSEQLSAKVSSPSEPDKVRYQTIVRSNLWDGNIQLHGWARNIPYDSSKIIPGTWHWASES